MQTYESINHQIEIIDFGIKRTLSMDEYRSDEITNLEQDKAMLKRMIDAIPTSIDRNNPIECKIWIDRFIAEEVRSMTLHQLAWFWTGYRFGYRDSYYRREWTNRLGRHGYEHFLGHMDGESRDSWRKLHDLWYDVTYFNKKPLADKPLSLEAYCYADLRDRLIIYHGDDDFVNDIEEWYEDNVAPISEEEE